VTNAHIANSLD